LVAAFLIHNNDEIFQNFPHLLQWVKKYKNMRLNADFLIESIKKNITLPFKVLMPFFLRNFN